MCKPSIYGNIPCLRVGLSEMRLSKLYTKTFARVLSLRMREQTFEQLYDGVFSPNNIYPLTCFRTGNYDIGQIKKQIRWRKFAPHLRVILVRHGH
jgi:hypothetical protein